MKSPQRPDSRVGEFEGSTSEEAVRLARRALGDDAPVRCWRTRHGGVFGFFAKETYVAALEPPTGAIETVKASRQRSVPRKSAGRESPSRAAPPSAAPAPSDAAPEETISNLVEATEDEVVLGSPSIPAAAFRDMLAEAEAAVSGAGSLARSDQLPVGSGPPPVDPDSPPVDRTGRPGPEEVPGIRTTLGKLGVPDDYLPDRAEATLDGLARSLSRLPVAPPLPTRPGSVVAVIGDGRDARRAARHVASVLDLRPSDLLAGELTTSGRQRVARRRSRKKTTVVVVEASLAAREVAEAAAWVKGLRPDHVLGAVPARAKRGDIERWQAELGGVDALAVSGMATTATPGELMGGVPIAILDGRPSSTLRWISVLLTRVLEEVGG